MLLESEIKEEAAQRENVALLSCSWSPFFVFNVERVDHLGRQEMLRPYAVLAHREAAVFRHGLAESEIRYLPLGCAVFH